MYAFYYLAKPFVEALSRQRFVLFPVTCLNHALFKMRKIQLRIIGDEPDKVIPIATLNPVLPAAAQDCMHFTGKKVRQNIGSDRERDRMKKIFNLCGKTRWRICINLYLDLKHLTFRESTKNLFPCLTGKKLLECVCLEEYRLHSPRSPSFFTIHSNFKAEAPHFCLKGFTV